MRLLLLLLCKVKASAALAFKSPKLCFLLVAGIWFSSCEEFLRKRCIMSHVIRSSIICCRFDHLSLMYSQDCQRDSISLWEGYDFEKSNFFDLSMAFDVLGQWVLLFHCLLGYLTVCWIVVYCLFF